MRRARSIADPAAIVPRLAAVDWNEITAIATGLLAVAAIIAAAVAAYAAKAAIEDLEASRESTTAAQETAERQIAAQHRPVLVPLTDANVTQPAEDELAVGIENIGPGAAMDVTAAASLLDVAGNRAGHGGEPQTIGTEMIGASQHKFIVLRAPRWSPEASFRMT